MKLDRVHNAHAVDSFFFFQIPFSDTLNDFKGFQLVIISVSFCDLAVELNQDIQVLAAPLGQFQDIFKMAGLARALEDVRSFTVLWGGAYFDYVFSQRQS